MTIGQRIYQSRINKGLTMQELGKAIGVGKTAISKYESGKITKIPSDKIEALAAALDVTPGYLMGWVDHPRQMNLWESAGASFNEQMAAYSEMGESQAKKSDKRMALESLINSATEEEIDLITQLVEAVIKNRK